MQALDAASALVASEHADKARTALEPLLARYNDPRLWIGYAQALRLGGEEGRASDILHENILKIPSPHIADIIEAGLPYCKPVIFGTPPIAYFAVPKCASSSLKAAIAAITGVAGEIAYPHREVAALERVLSFEEYDKEFSGAVSFLVIRHPRDRLRSYWQKNIAEEGSLATEAQGRATFYGLETRPRYNHMLRQFRRYRQVFRDFRHHSNAITGFVGRRERVRHVFAMKQVDEALALIGPLSQFASFTGKMRPKQRFDEADADTTLEDSVIAEFYGPELAAFFSGE
jgi:hypothetical protein